MAAPTGITCRCGATATRVNDLVSEAGHTFGQVWSCDDHANDKGTAVFEVPATEDNCNTCGRTEWDCNEAGDCVEAN